MWDKAKEAANYLRESGFQECEIAIVLGSGLGGLVNRIQIKASVSYDLIPHFSISTVEGHDGLLIYGYLSGKPVIAMQGRFHYYEGWSIQQTVFPIRVMSFLGVKTLLVSNASGGVNTHFQVGDIMLIEDHINFMPEHPLRGVNDTRFGPRFVDMHEPYDRDLIQQAKQVFKSLNIPFQSGLYLALQGPTFETPAEYNMVKNMGADAVGMSTVPEVIVAKHMGMRCFGTSVITDLGGPNHIAQVSHEEVQLVAKKAGNLLARFVESFVIVI